MPDQQDATGDPGGAEPLGGLDPALGNLRERLDQLQQSVEQLGPERSAENSAPERTENRGGGDAPSPSGLAIGPIPGLVDLRLLEEGIAGLRGVAGVRVRWFGRRWARIDVATSDSAKLEGILFELGRPMDLETEPGGLLVARFADVGGPPEPVPAGARLPAAAEPGAALDPRAAQSLPEAVCRHFLMVPIAFDGTTLTLAIVNPADRLARDVAAALTGAAVAAVPTTGEAIEEAIDEAFGPVGEEDEAGILPVPDETQRLADELGIPVIDLEGIEPTVEALELLPPELQREIPCLPLTVDDEALYVAIDAPLGSEAASEVGAYADGRRVRAYLASSGELEALADELHPRPSALRSPPPTAFPGNEGTEDEGRKRRWLTAVPLALWHFLRAPLPIGVALIAVGVLVYLYVADQLP